MSDLPRRSSGEIWTATEDETLRQLWHALVLQMEGRSHAAVITRLNILSERGYRQRWPEAPPCS